MKIKVLAMILIGVSVIGLSGCPAGGAGNLAGTWLYVQALTPGTDPIDTNFNNNGRLRVTLVFGEKTKEGLPFTYTAEKFLPDREARHAGDGGAAIVWDWKTVQVVEGFYQTAAFDPKGDILIWPQLNTELNVAITKWTTSEQTQTADQDTFGRNMLVLTPTESTADPVTNPLFWRALLGVTPLDELLVAWGETNKFPKATMPTGLNDSIGPVQTYRRVPAQ